LTYRLSLIKIVIIPVLRSLVLGNIQPGILGGI
jgi:hypothetical protein